MGGLNVTFVLATSAGGVGRHVRALAGGLVARGARVTVLGPAATEVAFGFTAAGAAFTPVEIADRPRPRRDAAALRRLRRLLRESPVPDVVHAHGLRAGALTALALRCPWDGGNRPALVVTLHNAPVAGGAGRAVYRLLEVIVARRADQVLGVCGDLVDRMRAAGARTVGRALVPAPQLPPPRRSPAATRADLGAADRPLLLTVARLADQKGLPVLLDAAAGWAGRTPPPLVAIAGDGPLEARLKARIAARGLPVRLLGRRDDVADLLAAADVVVVPSLWEGQPLIVQEALRAGRPLVATRVGGIAEMTGDAALLVPAQDPDALERAVARVLDDPELATRLAAAAAACGRALPREEHAVDQVLGLYTDLVARPPDHPASRMR